MKYAWIAQIGIDGIPTYLGSFKSEIEASQYYENAVSNHNKGLLIEIKKPVYSSKFTGVQFDKSRNKWKAIIRCNGKEKYLGRFPSERIAVRAIKQFKI